MSSKYEVESQLPDDFENLASGLSLVYDGSLIQFSESKEVQEVIYQKFYSEVARQRMEENNEKIFGIAADFLRRETDDECEKIIKRYIDSKRNFG